MAPSLRLVVGWALSVLLLASLVAQPAAGDDGGSNSQPNLRSRGLVLTKVYCLIVIFFATFLPGVSPYFLRWNQTFLVLGIQFAAGVFLSTAMLHFLGDSNSTFQELTPKTYPFAEMLAVSGYFITMLADLIIQDVYTRIALRNIPPLDVEANNDSKVKPERDIDSKSGGLKEMTDESAPQQLREVQHVVKVTLIHKASVGDTVLLISALCFHSVFEGIAIGVADTEYDAWKNLWTIALHKVFAAIAMGIALLRMMPNRPLVSCAAYALAFAISSPIGVAIGIAIDAETEGPTADWIYAISMGLATGIFIYVAINHLILKGFIPDHPLRFDKPWFKYFAFVAGCGVLFVAMIWDT